MTDYLYLATLLPTLRHGEPPPMSSARFLQEAEKWLTENDVAQLSAFSMSTAAGRQDTGNELVDEYCRLETQIRADVAAFVESRRAGREHKTRAFPTTMLKDRTPLEAERGLLRARWDFISARLNSHYADLTALLVYRLQLEILERLARFDAPAGRKQFDAVTNTDSIPEEALAVL